LTNDDGQRFFRRIFSTDGTEKERRDFEMRMLLIINIVLCLFILLIVPALVVLNGPFPGEVKTYIKENSLDDEAQAHFLEIIFKTTEFQRDKLRHKIILPQIVCGVMLITNICLLVKYKSMLSCEHMP